MAMERTLAMIKPDAVSRGDAGNILARYEAEGFTVLACKKTTLSRAEAEAFYAVHSERPFFNDLCDFMTSGPVFVSVLEGEDAVKRYREVLGATDPAKADAGTVRADFGTDVEKNAAHGSDGPDTARQEIAFFFPGAD